MSALGSLLAASVYAQESLWRALNSKADSLYEQGKYSEAVQATKEALEVAEKTFGRIHPATANSLNILGELYQMQGNYASAEPLFKQSLAIREKTLGYDHPNVAASLNNLALLYKTQGNFVVATSLYKRALSIYKKNYGSDHPYVATALNNLAGLYYSKGEYGKAEPLFKHALRIAEKEYGPNQPGVATGLNNLAVLYAAQGKYTDAEVLYKRLLLTEEKALGPNHPHVATALNNLAELYRAQGKYAEAELLHKRSLVIREKVFGPEHPDVALSLNNLALLYVDQGKYADAEPLYQRAVSIFKKVFGPVHPKVATALNNLAELYRVEGKYAAAEHIYKTSLSILEKSLGPSHPNVATSLNNLAFLYKVQGNYAAAEPLHRRSLSINEKALGPNHPNVATSLNNLAELYQKQGKIAEVESLYRRSLSIREKALGFDHPHVAQTLNNLALFYYSQGKYSAAVLLFKRSLSIREKTLGPDHPDVSQTLNNMALVYVAQGKYAEAESINKRSLLIKEKSLGSEHPAVAISLNNLARLYKSQGKYDLAELFYKRSLSILEKSLGPDHSKMATSLTNLAGLYATMDNNSGALRLMLKANAVEDKLIEDMFSFSSERERFLFLDTIEGHKHLFIAFCIERIGDTIKGRKSLLEYLLSRKGLVLDSLLQDAESARLSDDPELKDLLADLREKKDRLAKLALSGPDKEGVERYRAKMAKLKKESEELEKELARKSSRFKAEQDTKKIGLSEVSSAIPANGALVEFAKYQSYNFGAKGTEKKWGPYRYIACVLRKRDKVPNLVKLGDAETIENKIKVYRKALETRASGRGSSGELNRISGELAKIVWAPLIPALKGAKNVYISPDGELNFVSFAGLKNEKGKYLAEVYDLAYLSSGRDLARDALKRETGKGRPAALFGAPDFGGSAVAQEELLITRGTGFRSELSNLRAFGGMRFEPLPGARGEVSEIASMAKKNGFNPEANLGSRASEIRVKNLAGPEVLHLATHGFFLPESGWDTQKEERLITRGIGEQTVDLKKWKLENPMHRSGLALSGANLTLEGKEKDGGEDGILTAEEVAGLDLAGTKLAVLSACETGLGEAKGGEGVLGLRRAFVKAGAENLLMALWKVPDKSTRELMKRFYEKYLEGKPPARALLEAQREMIAEERASGKDPDPFLWGAFVCSGIGVN